MYTLSLFQLERLRGNAPTIHVIPAPTPSDSTARQEIAMATLAAAAKQVSKARTVLEESVVSQF